MLKIINNYNTNLKKYDDLEKKVRKNLNLSNSRQCHHKVVVLNILCDLFNVETYLEIGVHNGCSMSYIVSNSNVKKVYGIDLFENTYGHYINDNLNYEKVMKNIERNNINSNITLIKGDSTDLNTIKKFKDFSEKIDLLFIDGAHYYDNVKSDFINYSKFVKKNGLIVFDDYRPKEGDTLKWPKNIQLQHLNKYNLGNDLNKLSGIYRFVQENIINNKSYRVIGVFKDNELIIQKLF